MHKPFVLSVEGPGYINKGLWSTHKILGVFESRDAAIAALGEIDEEDIVLLTNTDTGSVERIRGA